MDNGSSTPSERTISNWVNWSQIIAAVAGIIALIFSIYVYARQQEKKALEVVILSNTLFPDLAENISSDISILYGGRNVENLQLIQVKLQNIGNLAIREADYAAPVEFAFDKNAEVAEAVTIESNPVTLTPLLAKSGSTAKLEPILLNPGDRTIIRFLVINTPPLSNPIPFRFDARIADVTDIRVINAIEEEKRFNNDFTIQFFILVAAFLIVFIFIQRWNQRAKS